MIDPVMLAILTVVAVGTSVISAIVGMGGGITLLAVMFFTGLPHFEIIALHAVVQMVSNAARTVAYRDHLTKNIAGAFFVGALPGFVLACLLVGAAYGEAWTKSPWFKIVIALWVFSALFRSKKKGDGIKLGFKGFASLGVIMVPLSTILGATGPIIAPYFLRKDLIKEQIVCSKAACQVATHVFKLLAIVIVMHEAGKFAHLEGYATAAILMSVSAIVGTWLGKKMMKHVDEELFRKLYRTVLAAAGIKIFFNDGVLKFDLIQDLLIPLLP